MKSQLVFLPIRNNHNYMALVDIKEVKESDYNGLNLIVNKVVNNKSLPVNASICTTDGKTAVIDYKTYPSGYKYIYWCRSFKKWKIIPPNKRKHNSAVFFDSIEECLKYMDKNNIKVVPIV